MKARRQSARGFTLIELMVALVAGSFVVAGAYYLSDVSARLFNEQVRRSETQMTLRTAAEQLRRDIGRAGFMAARDTNELWGCSSTQGDASVAPSREQGVRVTRNAGLFSLFLTGNFTTSDQYPLDASSAPGRLVLSPQREGFRRSFTNPALAVFPGNFLPQRFLSAFAPDPNNLAVLGRMVSVQDLSNGRIYFSGIVALNPANVNGPDITINPPLSTIGGCIPASMTGLVVAPVSTIRYMIEDPAADPELRLFRGATTLTGGARRVLVRREIAMPVNFGAPVPIPGTARVVLDFVDSFNIEAVWDQAMAIGAAAAIPNLVHTTTPETIPLQSAMRSLVVELVAGGAEAQVANAVEERASRIQNARRVTRMEVFMPNMARNPGVRP